MGGRTAEEIRHELKLKANQDKADFLPQFFQAFSGGYGEGDKFLGVTVPEQRKVARAFYKEIQPGDLESLLRDPFHECRLTALLIMVLKYEKAKTKAEKETLVESYLSSINYVNNWDLVDSSAPKLLGPHLENRERNIIYDLARSNRLWYQRIAVLTTYHFIRHGDFDDTLKLSVLLLNHEHDLIHKAVGWMLREVGKRDFQVEYNFLKRHYKHMPRTMLRYAIEKFDPELRKKFLIGDI
ncbi:MAG: DNA alkylation repair protein [Dethiobacteria bacterium]